MSAVPEFGQIYIARQPGLHSDVVITSINNSETVGIIDYDTGRQRIEIPTSLLHDHYRPETEDQP